MSRFFKPDWSPDLFMSCNYLNHLTVVRTELLRSVGGWRSEYDGSQDYDLYLRIADCAKEIVHIPKILYHWRTAPGSAAGDVGAKTWAHDAAQRALEDAMRRRNLPALVERGYGCGMWRVRYPVETDGTVSILLPSCNVQLLRQCIADLEKLTSYRNTELILVDNSREDAIQTFFDEDIGSRWNAKYIDHRRQPFNYSMLINRAAEAATGDFLLLLNDDVRPIHEDWIEAMLEHAQRSGVGAVGVKLLYPNDQIQHAGVVMGARICSHVFCHLPDSASGYFAFPHLVRNYSAVTAACLMVRKGVYQEVGGFDEKNLPTAFQDVDLCLKIAAKGYYNVYTPHARLYHMESQSRRKMPPAAEIAVLLERWGGVIGHDPFYNRNLSPHDSHFGIRTMV